MRALGPKLTVPGPMIYQQAVGDPSEADCKVCERLWGAVQAKPLHWRRPGPTHGATVLTACGHVVDRVEATTDGDRTTCLDCVRVYADASTATP